MRTPRLPGVPTIAALMLAAMIPVAVNFSGQIPYSVAKDFQTVIGALIALGAAAMAYRGAMAKVDHDKEIAERQRVADRLGLYLRLKSQLKRMNHAASSVQALASALIATDPQAAMESDPILVSRIEEQMSLSEFDEIENAWRSIQLLPLEATQDLDILRSCWHELLRSISLLKTHSETAMRGFPLTAIKLNSETLLKQSEKLVVKLDAAISRLPRFD